MTGHWLLFGAGLAAVFAGGFGLGFVVAMLTARSALRDGRSPRPASLHNPFRASRTASDQ